MKINISYNRESFKNLNPVHRFLSKVVTFKEVDGKSVIVLH